MKRYFIVDAKCGVTEGGMACGPVGGNVIVTVKYNDGDKTYWLSNAEVMGIPNFYLTDKDVFDDLMEENFEDEVFTEYMQECFVGDFEDLFLGEYADVFSSIADDPENPAVPLVRYVVTLTRCSMDEVDGRIEMAKGKYADELDIPVSDVEKDFEDELEAEEEEDEE